MNPIAGETRKRRQRFEKEVCIILCKNESFEAQVLLERCGVR